MTDHVGFAANTSQPGEARTGVDSATARGMLVAWANSQDGWVKEIVRRVITAGVPLGDDATRSLRSFCPRSGSVLPPRSAHSWISD